MSREVTGKVRRVGRRRGWKKHALHATKLGVWALVYHSQSLLISLSAFACLTHQLQTFDELPTCAHCQLCCKNHRGTRSLLLTSVTCRSGASFIRIPVQEK